MRGKKIENEGYRRKKRGKEGEFPGLIYGAIKLLRAVGERPGTDPEEVGLALRPAAITQPGRHASTRTRSRTHTHTLARHIQARTAIGNDLLFFKTLGGGGEGFPEDAPRQ